MGNIFCETCRFFVNKEGTRHLSDSDINLREKGKCCRYPPVDVPGTWEFPTIRKGDWCGEWQPKEE